MTMTRKKPERRHEGLFPVTVKCLPYIILSSEEVDTNYMAVSIFFRCL